MSQQYTLAELRDGTGFAPDARFEEVRKHQTDRSAGEAMLALDRILDQTLHGAPMDTEGQKRFHSQANLVRSSLASGLTVAEVYQHVWDRCSEIYCNPDGTPLHDPYDVISNVEQMMEGLRGYESDYPVDPAYQEATSYVSAYEAFRQSAHPTDCTQCGHASDCPLHNEPAHRARPCTCTSKEKKADSVKEEDLYSVTPVSPLPDTFGGAVSLIDYHQHIDGQQYRAIAGEVKIVEAVTALGFRTGSTEANWLVTITGTLSGDVVVIPGCKVAHLLRTEKLASSQQGVLVL